MIQDRERPQRFDDRLLDELKRTIVEAKSPGASVRGGAHAARPSRTPRRVAGAAALVVALVIGIVVALPIVGGEGARTPAFAVTSNANGTITVKIWSIEEAEALEQRLQDHGVPTAAYFLPSGKLCNPRGQEDGSPPIADRWIELEQRRLIIRETTDGAFEFVVDRSRLLDGYGLFIYMQYDEPEYGQPGPTVASIAAEYTSSDVSECQLVDGEVDGWFQAGMGGSS